MFSRKEKLHIYFKIFYFFSQKVFSLTLFLKAQLPLMFRKNNCLLPLCINEFSVLYVMESESLNECYLQVQQLFVRSNVLIRCYSILYVLYDGAGFVVDALEQINI